VKARRIATLHNPGNYLRDPGRFRRCCARPTGTPSSPPSIAAHLPASGGEQRIVRIAASLAVGHTVSLRDAIPGLDQRNLRLVTTTIHHAAGQRQ
jgi:hypothetical protein